MANKHKFISWGNFFSSLFTGLKLLFLTIIGTIIAIPFGWLMGLVGFSLLDMNFQGKGFWAMLVIIPCLIILLILELVANGWVAQKLFKWS